MNVIENIQRIRGEKRISQAEMAEKLGIAQNNYGKIERGITELTVERLYKIAEILGSSPSEILGLENLKLEENKENKKKEDLEKRIAELEDRIKDRNTLIDNSINKLDNIIEITNDLIVRYVYSKAEEFGLLTFEEADDEFGKRLDKIFKSNGIKIKGSILTENMKVILEKAYQTDSETLSYVCIMGLMVGSKIEEMKQIVNIFKSHSKDSKINVFDEHTGYLFLKHYDKFLHNNNEG